MNTRLNGRKRSKINRELADLPTHHDSVGLAAAAVLEVLAKEDLFFDATFIPKTGRTTATLRIEDETDGLEVSNSLLVLVTYEMELTGRVELTCYLS